MSRLYVPTSVPTTPRRARDAGADYGETAQPDWRGIDWAAHLHQVEIDGTPVNYVDIGPTEAEPSPSAGAPAPPEHELFPIVFVHGLAGQWQNWLENIPRAAQQRRVIALDLPGFGHSPMPSEEITIPGYGRCVDALCDKLSLGRVEMVGNSMGGFVAAEVAIQFPERVDQLILVSAAGISSADIAHRPILAAGRIIAAFGIYTAPGQRWTAARPKSRHAALALVARHPSRLKGDLAYHGFFTGTGKPGFHQALKASLEYDFRDRLPEISRPTLIVWGEKDSVIPVRDAHEYERLIPDSRKVVMRDTGHISMAERPVTFNELMLDFLAEQGPASAKRGAEGESQAA